MSEWIDLRFLDEIWTMSESLGKFVFREVNCPVCDENNATLLGYRGGDAHQGGLGVRTTIVRCVRCTHQYPNPMPFPAVGLSELYGEPEAYFQRHDLERKKAIGRGILSEFEHRLGSKGRLLDIGCGRGEVLWAAKVSGWEFEGLDTSKEFLEFAKTEFGIDGRLATVEEAAFPAESFDAVIMGGVIEHLYDPGATLREIFRILRPNGWLYFDAPNEDGLYMQVGNAYMKALGRDWVVTLAPTFSPYHVQGFNPTSLRKLLDLSKFDVRQFRLFGDLSPQTGVVTFRKSCEYVAARFVNWIGNKIGRGTYMDVWAQKGDS